MLTKTLLIDINVYALIKALSIPFLFSNLSKIKIKIDSIFLFLVLYLYIIIYPVSLTSLTFLTNLFIIMAIYFVICVKEKTLQIFMISLLSIVLSISLTLLFHFYLADDLIWWIMKTYDFFLSKNYNNFLLFIDFIITLILCGTIVMISEKKRYALSISIFVVSFILISIHIFMNSRTDVLIPLTIVSLLIILGLIYQMYIDYKKKLELDKMEKEIEINKLYYSNYKDQYYRLEVLKHDIVKTLGKHENVPVELYNDIDSLISPYISIYSSNPNLNMVLTESANSMKTHKIQYEFRIAEDFTFLNEEGIMFIFHFMIKKCLTLKNVQNIIIETKKENDNYSILISYRSEESLLQNDFELHPTYKHLQSQYQLWIDELEIKGLKTLIMNIVVEELKGSENL